jgi:hypothetical protein
MIRIQLSTYPLASENSLSHFLHQVYKDLSAGKKLSTTVEIRRPDGHLSRFQIKHLPAKDATR